MKDNSSSNISHQDQLNSVVSTRRRQGRAPDGLLLAPTTSSLVGVARGVRLPYINSYVHWWQMPAIYTGWRLRDDISSCQDCYSLDIPPKDISDISVLKRVQLAEWKGRKMEEGGDG